MNIIRHSFPRRRLSYAKLVQTECNQACLKLLRCSLSYAKLVQNIGISKFLSYIFLFIIFCMGLLCHVIYLCFLCKSVLSLFHNLRCLVCFVRNLIFWDIRYADYAILMLCLTHWMFNRSRQLLHKSLEMCINVLPIVLF